MQISYSNLASAVIFLRVASAASRSLDGPTIIRTPLDVGLLGDFIAFGLSVLPAKASALASLAAKATCTIHCLSPSSNNLRAFSASAFFLALLQLYVFPQLFASLSAALRSVLRLFSLQLSLRSCFSFALLLGFTFCIQLSYASRFSSAIRFSSAKRFSSAAFCSAAVRSCAAFNSAAFLASVACSCSELLLLERLFLQPNAFAWLVHLRPVQAEYCLNFAADQNE